jgi:phosphoribosylanthranilate isomerase
MKKIKFCNIKNLYETRTAGRLGVDYVGFHLISENDYKRIDEIKESVRELKMFYPKTKSVLVTKERDIIKLSDLIRAFEFDAIQLHYPDSDNAVNALRTIFNSNIEIFKVVTSENINISNLNKVDHIILDKSFLGGTGQEIGIETITKSLRGIKLKNIFLAGGISAENIYKYIDLDVEGFDIQSAIKSSKEKSLDNADANKMYKITKLLGKQQVVQKGQIGFAIQDIMQQNLDALGSSINAKVDFLHIDITDGFVSTETNLNLTLNLINAIKRLSSHIKIQYHIFAKTQDSYNKINDLLSLDLYNTDSIFIHINRDNYDQFDIKSLVNGRVSFGLDVKDLIDETFPWEQFINESVLICLQSKEHRERVLNFNRAKKMISYAHTGQISITLDRSIDLEVIQQIEDAKNLSIVSGSFLRKNLSENYYLLKNYLYVTK